MRDSDPSQKRSRRNGRRHSKPYERPQAAAPRDERRPGKPGEARGQIKSPLDRVFGKHSVEAILLKRPKAIRRLLIAGRESYYATIISECKQRGVVAEVVPWPEFMKIGDFAEGEKHQGILALVTPIHVYSDHDLDRLKNASCVLALDQVSNPQNLAAILRSASFFHADAVILMKHRSAEVTPEVQRYAVGGAEFVDIYKVTNLADTIDELKQLDFRVLGLDERGERTLAQVPLTEKTAFVIGAEGEGLRQKTREHCDELVRIPGGRKAVESLNASVATTIALYELYRLRT